MDRRKFVLGAACVPMATTAKELLAEPIEELGVTLGVIAAHQRVGEYIKANLEPRIVESLKQHFYEKLMSFNYYDESFQNSVSEEYLNGNTIKINQAVLSRSEASYFLVRAIARG